MQIQISALS